MSYIARGKMLCIYLSYLAFRGPTNPSSCLVGGALLSEEGKEWQSRVGLRPEPISDRGQERPTGNRQLATGN